MAIRWLLRGVNYPDASGGLGLIAFLVLAAQLSSCSPGSSPGASCGLVCECPASFVHVVLNVQASPDAGPLAGVGVAFTGAASGEMTCQPAGIGPGAVCRWPGPVTAGSYVLQVAAPGYQSADIPATLTVDQPSTNGCGCSCPGATLGPSTVTLDPSPDGG
jgi:hypothetical protein